MKEHFFDDRIYYRTNDFTEGRATLVFIHGLTGSASSWASYESIFENKYNILIYDMRGHGSSKKFPSYSDYERKSFVIDLNELITYLGIKKFILISHSMGTLIALGYIKSHPEKVVGNILFSPIVGIEKEALMRISKSILGLTRLFSLFPFNPDPKTRRHIDYTLFPNTTDWDIKRIYTDSRNTTLRTHLYCLKNSLSLDQEKENSLEKITVPTLIVHGVDDTMAKAQNSVALAKKIKNSELVLIPGTNHFFVLNKVKETADIIESFIEKNKTAFSLPN